MHSDQYLQWDSQHNLPATYSVISTLTHRARTVCTKPELLNQEMQHLRKAITKCKYPKWALDKMERRFSINSLEESNMGNNQREQSDGNTNNTSGNPEGRDSTKEKYNKGHTVIPYMQGLGDSRKIYAGGMASRPTSRETELLRSYWSNPRRKIL